MKKFRIYDNGGKTADRYTFVIREPASETLHFFSASTNPYHPQGVGLYCGDSRGRCANMAGAHLGAKIRQIAEVPEPVASYFAHCVRACGWDYLADCGDRLS